jgi:hypothetical protein
MKWYTQDTMYSGQRVLYNVLVCTWYILVYVSYMELAQNSAPSLSLPDAYQTTETGRGSKADRA